MTKIRYLDEEIQAVKDMYSRGFRIKDISVALIFLFREIISALFFIYLALINDFI